MVFVVFIALAILFLACLEPPIGVESSNDLGRYLQVNKYTLDCMREHSNGILPDESVIPTASVYEYRYSCAFFGDPDCLIYLRCVYDDKEEFDAEKKRAGSISKDTLEENDMVVYSATDNLFEKIDLYSDSNIEDGRKYVFEFAVVDELDQQIEYVFAVQYDGHEKSDHILGILSIISN